MNKQLDNLCAALEAMRLLAMREHYTCDDTWYSCPKSPEGCANEGNGDECICGADEHNAKVERLYAAVMQEEEAPVRWYDTVKVGDILRPWPGWNCNEQNPRRMLPEYCEVLGIDRTRACASGVRFAVCSSDGLVLLIDAGWFEPTQ